MLATASADSTVRLWKTDDLLGGADASPGSAEGDRTGGNADPSLQQVLAPPVEASGASASAVAAPGAVMHKELKGHQRWVWDCSFSADSAYLVSSSSDQTAKLWDIAQGEPIRTYSGHTKAVTAVSLNDIDTTAG